MTDLAAILVNLATIPDENLEEYARNLYSKTFIQQGQQGFALCHDGNQVVFWQNRFDHAFFTPKKWKETSVKQIIDKRRVERMQWILPLIRGEVINSQCWHIKQNLLKRMYCIKGQGYVVWLESNGDNQWRFSTAYVADMPYIFKQTRGGSLIWQK